MRDRLTPIVISFEVAKNQYKKNPTKDVYKPNSGGRLARIAYAMPWGMTTKPTVTPTGLSGFIFLRVQGWDTEDLRTSDEVSEQPSEVVVTNPSYEWEEAVKVPANTINGRDVLAEEFIHCRFSLEVGAIVTLRIRDYARVVAIFDAKEPVDAS